MPDFRSTLIRAAAASALVVTVAAAPLALVPAARLTPAILKSALAPGSPVHSALVSQGWTAPGKLVPAFTAPPPPPISETPIDLSSMLNLQTETASSLIKPEKAPSCAAGTIAPQIASARGKITSGGYIVITGACFGNAGRLIISGALPGESDIHTVIQAWTPTAITAQLPVLTGVPNNILIVQVQRTLTSKPFPAPFTAAVGPPIPLLTGMTLNVCGGSDTSVCEADAPHPAVGAHADLTPQNGSDVWTVKIPPPFTLSSITLVQLANGPVSGSVITQSAQSVTFKVVWTELENSSFTEYVTTQSTQSTAGSSNSIWGAILTGGASLAATSGGTQTTSTTTAVNVPIYSEGYRIQVNVTGPLGMIPPV